MTTDPIEGTIPTYGAIPAPNLTSGQGGVGLTYSDTDWVRAMVDPFVKTPKRPELRCTGLALKGHIND
jgi:hypothetical protein